MDKACWGLIKASYLLPESEFSTGRGEGKHSFLYYLPMNCLVSRTKKNVNFA